MAGDTDAERRAAEIRAKKLAALSKIDDDREAQKARAAKRAADGVRKAQMRRVQSEAAKVKQNPKQLARKDSQDVLGAGRRASPTGPAAREPTATDELATCC